MKYDPKSIPSNEAIDPRLYRLIQGETSSGQTWYVKVAISMFNLGGAEVFISRPNVIGIFLSMADQAARRAIEIFQNDLMTTIEEIKSGLQFKGPDADSKVLGYTENLFISIVFAYAAAEAFANAVISDDYTYEYKGESRDKTYLQRHAALVDKFKVHIPRAYNIATPSSHKSWNAFIELEKLRNGIIHYKADGDNYNEPPAPFLRYLYAQVAKYDVVSSARDIMAFVAGQIPDQKCIPNEFANNPFLDPDPYGNGLFEA